MTYILINLCVIVGVFFFYKMTNSKENIQINALFPFLILVVFQSILSILLVFLVESGLRYNFIEKCYIFSLYCGLIILIEYSANCESDGVSNLSRIGNIILTVILFYYCFFIKDGVAILDNSVRLSRSGTIASSLGSFAHFMRSVFPFLIFVAVLFILSIRILLVKTPLVKFKLLLILLTLCLYFSIFEFTLFSQTALLFFYNIYSLVVFFTLLLLYQITVLDHIPSIKTIGRTILDMFLNYGLFGVLATLSFVIYASFYRIESYILLAFTFILLFGVFALQLVVRSSNTRKKIKNAPVKQLARYFENIDFKEKKETVIHNFANMLKGVFDSSSIEFYTLDGAELFAIYSTRKFTKARVGINSKLFMDIFKNNEKYVYEKNSLNTKNSFDKELYELFELFDSEILVFVGGDRGIISVIAFGKKLRTIEYCENDIKILQSFYPNFFVFGYYLQTSMKDALMDVIVREIAMSGQVTESIYKNIDKVTDPSLETAYISRSVRNLGGDFIDFIRLTDTQHMFVLGDVSGRGLNASMCMIIMKTFIRTFLAQSSDFIGLLNTLNKFIKQNLPRGTFFAGTFLIYDTSDKMLYYVNCGVPGIFLYTKSYNNVIEIQGEGKVLGFVNDVSKLLTVRKIQLSAGDVVLTCTDGVTESTSLRGEEYGKGRIANQLVENKFYPADKICSFLFDDIFSFTAKGVSDDTSVLVIKIKE